MTGYDNVRPPEWLPVGDGLTTLDQNYDEMAQLAARLIHGEKRRLADAPGRHAPHVLVPATLIVRTSTGPPRN